MSSFKHGNITIDSSGIIQMLKVRPMLKYLVEAVREELTPELPGAHHFTALWATSCFPIDISSSLQATAEKFLHAHKGLLSADSRNLCATACNFV